MEIKTGYKVIRREGSRNVSVAPIAIDTFQAQEYGLRCTLSELEYKNGEWTERPNKKAYGPMCVFEDVESACHFAGSFSSAVYHIWRCSYVPNNIARRIWFASRKAKYLHMPFYYLPCGTILADKVRIEVEVNHNVL